MESSYFRIEINADGKITGGVLDSFFTAVNIEEGVYEIRGNSSVKKIDHDITGATSVNHFTKCLAEGDTAMKCIVKSNDCALENFAFVIIGTVDIEIARD